MDKKILKRAFRDTLPVMAGYLVLGTGFGIIMNKSGFGTVFAVLMSVFIYAGSMQYAALSLFTGGAGLITYFLTTLAVNLRHIFYGISMIDNYKGMGKIKPYLIFSLTDETYSLVCGEKKEKQYYAAVSLIDHFYWVTGTLFGALIGNAISFDTKGIDFALTALFITIFTDQWMRSEKHFAAIVGVLSSVLCLAVFGSDKFLIPAMVLIFFVLIAGMKGEKND